MGAPGAGKGTQAKLIADKYNLPHIATGDLLRNAVAKQSELGNKANEYMSRGELVPDQIVIDMIKERLENQDARSGYILDGFPRTLEQAKRLSEIEDVDVVLNIDVNFNVLIDRLTGRRSCGNCGAVYHIIHNPPKSANVCDRCGAELSQRSDDREEVIRNRLETYDQRTKPLIQFYENQNKLKNIPGSGGINKIFNSIVVVLDGFR